MTGQGLVNPVGTRSGVTLFSGSPSGQRVSNTCSSCTNGNAVPGRVPTIAPERARIGGSKGRDSDHVAFTAPGGRAVRAAVTGGPGQPLAVDRPDQ